MKLIISTIVGAIIFFIFGWLIFWVLFAGQMTSLKLIMRSPEQMTVLRWAILSLGMLSQAFLLSYFYKRTYKGESPFKEGFLYGFSTGLLLSVPYIFYIWSIFTVTYRTAIVDGIINFFIILIAGIVIGLIFGKKEKPEIKETNA